MQSQVLIPFLSLIVSIMFFACKADDLEPSGDGEAGDSDIEEIADDGKPDGDPEADRDWDGFFPEVYPDSVKCWQYGSKSAARSLDDLEVMMEACEMADSGHENYYCYPIELKMLDASGLQYAVQCEARHVNNTGYPVIPESQYMWLGPDYGNFENDIGPEKVNGIPSEFIGHFIDGSLYHPYHPCLEDMRKWTADRIGDILAYDLIDGNCETIRDYRQCVRSFKAPNTHCMPVFINPIDFKEEIEECKYNEESFWKIPEFFACVSRYEPQNQMSRDFDYDTWLKNPIRNTVTGECCYITEYIPYMENWETISMDELEDCP